MYRLYGTSLLNNTWECINIEKCIKHTYKLINKKTKDVYFFVDIIGLEQVTEDEFLVLKKVSDEYEIARIKLDNGSKYVNYKHTFNKFAFITDDYILFKRYNNSKELVFDDVYSIRKNKDLEEAKWLNSNKVDIIADFKTNTYSLIFEHKIYGNKKDILLFGVDIDTFLPNTPCYSTLRDSYINVNSKEDLKKLKQEDEHYKFVIDSITSYDDKKQKEHAKEKILKRSSH